MWLCGNYSFYLKVPSDAWPAEPLHHHASKPYASWPIDKLLYIILLFFVLVLYYTQIHIRSNTSIQPNRPWPTFSFRCIGLSLSICVTHLVLLGGVVEVEFGGSKSTHDRVENTELSSRQGTNHDATRGQTNGAQLPETNLTGNVA